MNNSQLTVFQKTVWEYYDLHARRALPWREPEPGGTFDPYKILVSELMLQQTQVPRVIPKYRAFLEQFPDIEVLAAADLGDVIKAWQGLGYNRRAKFLWQTAQKLHIEHHDNVPNTIQELIALPGVGPNTAGAIMAYAFCQPVVYLETNIRTVFIHHFFADQIDISDALLVPYITASLPDDQALTRDWYWALMDYGSYLKATVGNLNKLSNTYAKQSAFKGSKREIRGKVLRVLTESPHTLAQLQQIIADERLEDVLQDLVDEALIKLASQGYCL
jgi:A/G-specific adenine glycosylase